MWPARQVEGGQVRKADGPGLRSVHSWDLDHHSMSEWY